MFEGESRTSFLLPLKKAVFYFCLAVGVCGRVHMSLSSC